MSMPVTARAKSLMSPTRAHAVGAVACARRRPSRASSCASESSRSSCLRSSSSLRDARRQVFKRHFKFGRRRLGELTQCCAALRAARAGQRLDAAHAGGDAAVGDARDQADVAGAAHMRAAAQLDRPAERIAAAAVRILAHRHDAHLVAVFLAEQRARAGGARVVERHQPRRHRRVLQHIVVGDVLDPLDLLGRHRLRMREVEAQPVGRDQRALLRDVIAQHLAQRLVQQMRRRMVAADARCGGRDRRRARALRRP